MSIMLTFWDTSSHTYHNISHQNIWMDEVLRGTSHMFIIEAPILDQDPISNLYKVLKVRSGRNQ